jgi:hypothetical protein
MRRSLFADCPAFCAVLNMLKEDETVGACRVTLSCTLAGTKVISK